MDLCTASLDIGGDNVPRLFFNVVLVGNIHRRACKRVGANCESKGVSICRVVCHADVDGAISVPKNGLVGCDHKISKGVVVVKEIPTKRSRSCLCIQTHMTLIIFESCDSDFWIGGIK